MARTDPLIVLVVGARPNFVKMAPVIAALEGRGGLRRCVVHTGQHYDARMSEEILADLDFPAPDRFLGIGSGTHGAQTAAALSGFEQILLEERPDAVVVAGDVNSTLACALAAAKLGIRIAHIESGLRSGDWTMPEEINRVLCDRLSTWLFTHSPEAEPNLRREGIEAPVHAVGNTMIDSLRLSEPAARERAAWRPFGIAERSYLLVTLHRPSNVDDPLRLEAIGRELAALAPRLPIVFPIHPRTRMRLEEAGLLDALVTAGVRCTDALSYLDFLSLEIGAGAVLTDSGGLQEETSALGVPCFTLRPNTERPVTIELGTNVLLGDDPAAIARVSVPRDPPIAPAIPGWDGHAGARAADVLEAALIDRAPVGSTR